MSAALPTVSVIVPVRNGARFVRAALDSLLAQTFTDFEALVVDDASTDRTREILDGCQDPRVRVIHTAARLGPAGARNLGLEHARSPYIAFFDADDIADPQRLELQMDHLRRHTGAGLVVARAAIIDEQGRPTGAVWGWHGDDALIGPSMCFRNQLPTSTVLLDRRALGNERFDPTLEVASDYDLWLRVVTRAGATSLPQPLVKYRVHGANLTHRRAAAVDECLERIARRQLERLGVTPSHDEMATHRLLAAGTLPGTRSFLDAAEGWLMRVEQANRVSGVFSSRAFEAVIEKEWLAACDAAARAGTVEALPRISGARLTRRAAASRDGRAGLGPIPWRMLRGYVRRRLPGSGARLRALVPRQ